MTFIFLVVAVIGAGTLVTAINRSPAIDRRSHAAPAAVPAPRAAAARVRPVPERLIMAVTDRKYCIGGTLCPGYCAQQANGCETEQVYRISLPRRTDISRITLYASDDVGVTHVAELVIMLDGRRVGRLPVRWEGSTLGLPVGRTGRHMTIEARDPTGSRFAGEEAIISDIKVFGRPAK